MVATFTFDINNKLVIVDMPFVQVTIQEIVDAVRDWQDELDVMYVENIMNASGKEDLGGGILVGITIQFLNGWRLQFHDRPGPAWVVCYVGGGNITALDAFGIPQYPVANSAFVSVIITNSAAAVIVNYQLDDLKYRVEALNASHHGTGTTIYWDPVNGNDTLTGVSPTLAVKTFARAHFLAVDYAHDLIQALPGNPVGDTVTNEQIVITKNQLIVRGPGTSFTLAPLVGGDTVTIAGDGVGFEGFNVTTFGVGVNRGIVITGDEALIQDARVENTTSDGIYLQGSARSELDHVEIEGSGGHGMNCGNNVTGLNIIANHIHGNTGDGINLGGAGITECQLTTGGPDRTIIHDNGGYGIDIVAGTTDTLIDPSVTVVDNTLGNIHDLGTATFIGGFSHAAEFGGFVYIDVASGTIGTNFPRGTPGMPVNNLADAYAIAVENGIRGYNVRGMITLDRAYTGWAFVGGTSAWGDIVIFNGKDVTGSRFDLLTVTGTMVGVGVQVTNGFVSNVVDYNGGLGRCGIAGTLKMQAGSTCVIDVGFLGAPTIIDMNGNAVLNVTGSGDVSVQNMGVGSYLLTMGNNIRMTLQASCTGGNADIRGIGSLTDGSAGTVVVSNMFSTDTVWDELIAGHLGVGSTGKALSDAAAGAAPAVVAAAVWDEALAGHVAPGTAAEALDLVDDILALLENKLTINSATSELELWDAAGLVIIKKWPLRDRTNIPVVLQGTGPVDRLKRTL